MQVLNRNLIALALGAALVAPAAFAQAKLGPVATPSVPTTSAGQATAQSAISAERPTVPTLPTQSDTRASDAVTKKTSVEKGKKVEADATITTTTDASTDASTDAAKAAGSAKMSSSAAATQKAMGADTNPGKGNWWQAADADGDGKLSTTEANANAGLASRFATIDANKDGFVTNDEYRTFYTANASQGEQHAAAHSAVVTRDVWVKLDADADSRISLAEAAANASLTGSFATMDSNSDGFVTQDEYTAYTKANK